jgi:hypothetical protein
LISNETLYVSVDGGRTTGYHSAQLRNHNNFGNGGGGILPDEVDRVAVTGDS